MNIWDLRNGRAQVENGEGLVGLTATMRHWSRERECWREKGLSELVFGKIKLLTKLLKYWEKQLILGTDKTKQIWEREQVIAKTKS